jgi:para-nitrobenzyl esterase
MAAYWSSFARTGRPAPAGLPDWSKFESDKAVMRFEPGPLKEYDAGAAHKCAFWLKLYPQLLGD